jgi:non-homologous end joining protein Ku
MPDAGLDIPPPALSMMGDIEGPGAGFICFAALVYQASPRSADGGVMSARPSWSGFFKCGLVTFPVRAYTASTSADVALVLEKRNAMQTEDHNAVKIDTIVDEATVDPAYLADNNAYYLMPDDDPGAGDFAFVQRAMVEEKKVALARVLMHGKEQLVMLRPVENLLAMQVLDYPFQARHAPDTGGNDR